jgi:hypothetical protein
MYASSWDISEILSFLYFVLMKFWNKINKRWLWNQDCTIIHPFCTQTSIFTKFLHFLLKTQYCYIRDILCGRIDCIDLTLQRRFEDVSNYRRCIAKLLTFFHPWQIWKGKQVGFLWRRRLRFVLKLAVGRAFHSSTFTIIANVSGDCSICKSAKIPLISFHSVSFFNASAKY